MFGNLWNASLHSSDVGVMTDGTSTLCVSDCPTNSFWFHHFMQGFHEQVGDLIKQDLGITSLLMVKIMRRITLTHEADPANVDTVEFGLYCMISHLGAL